MLPFAASGGDVIPELVQPEAVLVARSVAPDATLMAQYIAEMSRTSRFSNYGPLHEALREILQNTLLADRVKLFSSATAALVTVLRALDVSGEVITTPFTFAATPHAITWAGATPVFVDIDDNALTLDPARVEAAITPLTTAIVAVHIYGMPCDVAALEDIAARHRLKLVFDAAHAFGTHLNDVPIHRWGDASVYSTHASKLFHTGEGGVLVCRDEDVAQRAERLQNFGLDADGVPSEAGVNSKMSEIQAALGLSVLPHVAAERGERQRLARRYLDSLSSIKGVKAFELPNDVTHSLQYFAVRVSGAAPSDGRTRRDAALNLLAAHNIHARRYFYPLCSDFPHYRTLPSAQRQKLPKSVSAANEMLCLPFHGGVSDSAQNAIATLLSRLDTLI